MYEGRCCQPDIRINSMSCIYNTHTIHFYFSRGWGFCLQDEPKQVYPYPYPDKPPGVLYDVSHQCRLQYGSEADHCDGIEVSATIPTPWSNMLRCVLKSMFVGTGTWMIMKVRNLMIR